MRKVVRLATAILLVAGGCGGGGIATRSGPLSVSLLDRVRVVGLPIYGGANLAAFALGRVAPGTGPDLFLVPTNGYPGCAVVTGPAFQQSSYVYGWAGYGNAHSVAVADFVEDGFANDAVVTSLAAASGQTSIMGALPAGSLSFLYPNPWHEVQTGLATRLVAGDWDDDDHLDLAILEPLPARVRILLGDGAGNFASSTRASSTIDTDIVPTAILTADFNEDLQPDLAIASAFAGTVTILLGDGSGGFSPAPDVMGVPSVLYMTATDLDEDGHIDLVLSSNAQDEVAIVRGNGDGTFTAPTIVSLPANSAPTGIAAADLDGDGDVDLVVGLTDDDDIAVILNNGSGGMSLPGSFRYSLGVGGLPRQVEVADLEGDGDLDVFVLMDSHVVVFEQT